MMLVLLHEVADDLVVHQGFKLVSYRHGYKRFYRT